MNENLTLSILPLAASYCSADINFSNEARFVISSCFLYTMANQVKILISLDCDFNKATCVVSLQEVDFRRNFFQLICCKGFI